MSRRTFPRAVAAGLVVAALGGPAAAQVPNPWRGESALPTAPAPRAVTSKPTRTLSIGFGFSSVGGLTATIQVRGLTPAMPPKVEAPEVIKFEDGIRTLPAEMLVRPLQSSRYLDHTPQYFPPSPAYPLPRELAGAVDPAGAVRSGVVRASYLPVPSYMPPPAPLPVQYIPPAAK